MMTQNMIRVRVRVRVRARVRFSAVVRTSFLQTPSPAP